MLPPWAFEVLRVGTRFSSRLLWQLRSHGTENIPPPSEGGLLIAANHQTYFDPFWISIPIKRQIRYLAWDAAFNLPVLGQAIQLLGAWPLQLKLDEENVAAAREAREEAARDAGREDAKEAGKEDERGTAPAVRPAIRRALQWLRGGGALLIFPEGARARADGQLGSFKPGAARMALEANVPVLPVTIRGGHRVWPRHRLLPRPGPRLEITYHPLYRVERRAGEDVRRCAVRASRDLAEIIRTAL